MNEDTASSRGASAYSTPQSYNKSSAPYKRTYQEAIEVPGEERETSVVYVANLDDGLND